MVEYATSFAVHQHYYQRSLYMSNENTNNVDYTYDHEVGCTCGCDPAAFNEYKKQMLVKIAISAVSFIVGYIVSEFTSLPDFVYLICFTISYIVVGFQVVRDAIELLLDGNVFNEYLLISVVSIGALAIREYHEGCAVMLLFAIGDFLQSLAVSKSQDKINKMIVDSDVSDEEVNNEQSNLSKLENEVNGTGSTNRFITRFAQWYTPIVFAIAIAVILIPPIFFDGEWKEWIYRGLSALVVGCPCAIVISVPLSFYFGIGAVVKDEKNGEFYAKRASSIAKQNIVLTLAVKLAVLVLVVFLNRELPMWFAVFSDIGICLVAILNSVRSAVTKK
jgi:cation transport ATPase